MRDDYFRFSDETLNQNRQAQGLLGAGWRPLYRQFDPSYMGRLVLNDTSELFHKSLNLISNLANATGRREYSWLANCMNLFSQSTRYDLDEFWNYITPGPPSPDYRYKDTLSVEMPVRQLVNRDSIPIHYVLNRLQEITIQQVLQLLGRPELITQYYLERTFYFPVDRFISWERLDVLSTAYAYWPVQEVWLQIDHIDRGRRLYTLLAQEMAHLINKATYGLAVMLSGYQSRVGQLQAQFPLRSFPADIQQFSDQVQQAVLAQPQLAVLVSGEPGTGKTAWTQAIAKEVLVPLGYVVFILDHDAVENFVPPTYLERVCLIINEADNLAQDRSLEVAQRSNRTEHILSLLDGTLYQSVMEEGRIQSQQQLVVLMTCNTTERLDPAMLRKGRVDLTHEFTYRFV